MSENKKKDTNILSPVVDLLWESGKAVGRLALGITRNVDWDKEFEYLKLENKEGIRPRLKTTQEDKYFVRYMFTLPMGITVKDFEKHIERFYTIFKLSDKDISLLRISRNGGYATIVLDKDTFNKEVFPYEEYAGDIKPSKYPNLKVPLGMYIGEDKELHLLKVDFSDSNTPHFSTAGTTGSGKTNVVKSILTFLASANTPKQLTMSICDLKGTECGDFMHLPHLTHFTTEAQETCQIIDEVVAMMETRYITLKNAGCKDIKAYLNKGKQMPYHLLLIDEFPELSILADSKYCEEVDPEVISKLRRILNKGRSCGIILGLSSQTNKATTLPTELRSNIPVTIGLRARDKAHSEGICGMSGLQDLRNKGMANVYGLVDRPFYTIRTLYMPETSEELSELLPGNTPVVKDKEQPKPMERVFCVNENVKTISGFDLNKEELFSKFRNVKKEEPAKNTRKPRHRNSKKSKLADKLDSLE